MTLDKLAKIVIDGFAEVRQDIKNIKDDIVELKATVAEHSAILQRNKLY